MKHLDIAETKISEISSYNLKTIRQQCPERFIHKTRPISFVGADLLTEQIRGCIKAEVTK